MKKLKPRKNSIRFTQPSLTQQHSKDETDINNIMARYIKTGVIDHVSKYQPQYTENTEADYHASMNIVLKANQMFSELPAAIRKQFQNDPASFLDFVNDENNHDKLQEMGLTNKPITFTETKTTPPAKPAVTETEEIPAPAS